MQELQLRTNTKHKLSGIRFSGFYKEAKRCMKSKGWKATWTKTPQSQELSESFCWQLSPVSNKTQLLSPFVHPNLFPTARLRQGVCAGAGKGSQVCQIQDGSVMGGHLASGCAACEWHEMNLQRALWIPCPLSSQWGQPLTLCFQTMTPRGGWHSQIFCAMLGFSDFFFFFPFLFSPHSFPSNLEL